MRILVTGGAGYIGSAVVHRLLNHGHQVRVADALTNGGQSLIMACRDSNFSCLPTIFLVAKLQPRRSRDVRSLFTWQLSSVLLLASILLKWPLLLTSARLRLYLLCVSASRDLSCLHRIRLWSGIFRALR